MIRRTRPKLLLVLAVLVTAVFLKSQCFAQDEGTTGKAELQLLSKYIGTWDIKYENSDPKDAGAVVTGEWVLDGKYVRRTGKLTHAKNSHFIEMLTFDESQKCYRRWTFDSRLPFEYKGTWNEQTGTMTWVAEIKIGQGGLRESTNTFTDNSEMKWETQGKNHNNEIVGNPVRGTATKRVDAK